MTPAQFDTRRRLLGLSIQETAELCGTSRRTVERWISGYSDVSTSAVARLERLEDEMSAAVEQACAGVMRNAPDEPVHLIRYRSQTAAETSVHAGGMPLGAHAILIGWMADALEADGVDVEIVWGD